MSTSRKILFAMLSFGMCMGIIFPLYASLFTDCRKGMTLYFALGCIGAGAIVGAVNYFITRLLVFRKIGDIGMAIKRISLGEGALTQRLDAFSKDEIGFLAAQFNSFAEKLRQMIKVIEANSSPLFISSEDLAARAMNMSALARGMTTEAEMVAAATEQASSTVRNIAENGEALSRSVNAVASSIEEMSASLNEVSKNCQQEARIVREANIQTASARDTINALLASAKEIVKVVDVINDIADQTNLLALNATIEAASVGEAGKGFAVVAGEVKELARQSAGATDGIRSQIAAIQNNSLAGAQAIQAVIKIMEEVALISQMIVAAIEQQSATINEIAKNTTQSGGAANRIAADVHESAQKLTEISGKVNKMTEATNETSTEAEKVNDNTMQITMLAANLQKAIKRFKA